MFELKVNYLEQQNQLFRKEIAALRKERLIRSEENKASLVYQLNEEIAKLTRTIDHLQTEVVSGGVSCCWRSRRGRSRRAPMSRW